jgi:hypothetical protein
MYLHSFSVEIYLALALYFLVGLARALRILRDGRFIGLPFALTSLVWAPIVFLEQNFYPLVGAFIIIATTFAMIWSKVKN